MSAEYQPNLSFVSQIPAEFLKLREYSANPDISWIFFISQPILKKKFGWGVLLHSAGVLHSGRDAYRDAYRVSELWQWTCTEFTLKVIMSKSNQMFL